MLGWIIIGAFLSISSIIPIVFKGFFCKNNGKEEMEKNGLVKGVVKDIVNNGNVTHISLDAIDDKGNEKEVIFEVDDYDSNEIKKKTIIYV